MNAHQLSPVDVELFKAILDDNLAAVKTLVEEKGANVNAIASRNELYDNVGPNIDTGGNTTPISLALFRCNRPCPPGYETMRYRRTDIIEYLLSRKPNNIFEKNLEGSNALYVASVPRVPIISEAILRKLTHIAFNTILEEKSSEKFNEYVRYASIHGVAISQQIISGAATEIGVGNRPRKPDLLKAYALYSSDYSKPAQFYAAKIMMRLNRPHLIPKIKELLNEAKDIDLLKEDVKEALKTLESATSTATTDQKTSAPTATAESKAVPSPAPAEEKLTLLDAKVAADKFYYGTDNQAIPNVPKAIAACVQLAKVMERKILEDASPFPSYEEVDECRRKLNNLNNMATEEEKKLIQQGLATIQNINSLDFIVFIKARDLARAENYCKTRGATANAVDQRGTTALMWAISSKDEKIIDFVLAKKPTNIFQKTKDKGETIFTYAISKPPLSKPMVFKLITAAAKLAKEEKSQEKMQQLAAAAEQCKDFIDPAKYDDLGALFIDHHPEVALKWYQRSIEFSHNRKHYGEYGASRVYLMQQKLPESFAHLEKAYDVTYGLGQDTVHEIRAFNSIIECKLDDSTPQNLKAKDAARDKLAWIYLHDNTGKNYDEKKAEEIAGKIQDRPLAEGWHKFFAARRTQDGFEKISLLTEVALAAHGSENIKKGAIQALRDIAATAPNTILANRANIAFVRTIRTEIAAISIAEKRIKKLENLPFSTMQAELDFNKGVRAELGVGEYKQPDLIDAVRFYRQAKMQGVLAAGVAEAKAMMRFNRPGLQPVIEGLLVETGIKARDNKNTNPEKAQVNTSAAALLKELKEQQPTSDQKAGEMHLPKAKELSPGARNAVRILETGIQNRMADDQKDESTIKECQRLEYNMAEYIEPYDPARSIKIWENLGKAGYIPALEKTTAIYYSGQFNSGIPDVPRAIQGCVDVIKACAQNDEIDKVNEYVNKLSRLKIVATEDEIAAIDKAINTVNTSLFKNEQRGLDIQEEKLVAAFNPAKPENLQSHLLMRASQYEAEAVRLGVFNTPQAKAQSQEYRKQAITKYGKAYLYGVDNVRTMLEFYTGNKDENIRLHAIKTINECEKAKTENLRKAGKKSKEKSSVRESFARLFSSAPAPKSKPTEDDKRPARELGTVRKQGPQNTNQT